MTEVWTRMAPLYSSAGAHVNAAHGIVRPVLERGPIHTTTDDGWTLRGERIEPAGDPVACAVLGHAMMVDRRTMDRRGDGLATTLARRGIATLSFDLRGHGESGPTAREGGSWSYDSFVRLDLPAIVAEGRRHHPNLPVVLVGHSLAGHAGMISAGLLPERAPDAVVGLGANLWTRDLEPSRALRVLKGAALATWAAASIPRGYWDPVWVRMGTDAEPWPYVWQFLRCYLGNRLSSLDGRDDYEAALGRAELPVFAVSSTGDRLFARPAAVRRFLAHMRRARVVHRVVTEDDVRPPPDHMGLVVNEGCRPIWEEVAGWIVNEVAGR